MRTFTALTQGSALVCLLVGSTAQAQRDSAGAAQAFERGRGAHRGRQANDAVNHFERAVALDPANAVYQMWLGHAYSRQLGSVSFIRKASIGRRVGEAYARAVALDPTNVEAAEARMDFLLEAPGIVGGGVDKARAEAARIGTLNAFRGRLAEARIAEHLKDPAKAERAYRAAIVLEPDSARPVDGLTLLLLNAGRHGEAFRIVDERLARYPNEMSTLYNLGRVASVSGERLSAGEAALRRFITLPGVDSLGQGNAHYRLGLMREKAGDLPAARTEYRRAMALVAGHKLAVDALKRLEGR
jgi:tetratricopeptide (TPR) repeat protein